MNGEDERPRGASHWARAWGVHRHTARALLRHLHRTYGARVVWRVRHPRTGWSFQASAASLQVVRVIRAERNLILVIPGGKNRDPGPAPERLARPRDAAEEEFVTQEQHARALAEVWRALERAGIRR